MELEKSYDASKTEDGIYQKWLESGFFNPDNLPDADKREPYTIIMPPPNVTGTLHVGHALGMTIEDVLIRYQRMQGKRALWIPGTDHAAIATQSKVEGMIYKEENKTRHDLGREEFLCRVEIFAQDSHNTIVNQIKKLGASCDWSREAFTLDAARSRAVRTAFKRMYDAGLIYRGSRIVNWDPKLQTTVSDDEIEWKEEIAPLYYLKYGPFTIATARPETKFGDKYVVMHPADDRYKDYEHGQKIELEWINGPITATVIKDESIDMEFGTGAMTITPWHDATDFEIAERHKLDKEQIINERGILFPIAGEFGGQHIKKARPMIVEKLQSKGLIEKIDDKYTHRIATNSRGGGIIEPQIKLQWFIDVNKKWKVESGKSKVVGASTETSLKELMRNAVDSGQIDIVPDHFKKIYFHWIDNLRDWCISRQIWYGHRIPVWYCGCGQTIVEEPAPLHVLALRHGESEHNAKKVINGDPKNIYHLTKKGEEQASAMAEQLAGKKVDVIMTSEMLRTQETADFLSQKTGIPITIDKRLNDIGAGELEGTNILEFRKTTKEATQSVKGSETIDDLTKRLKPFLNDTIKNYSGKTVVIVSSEIVLHCLKLQTEGRQCDEKCGHHIENAQFQEFVVDMPLACPACGSTDLKQDTDTLDTWFSSGLWTFSTLGWPDNTKDLQLYHPTSILETGYDILFFWVARMVLMTGYLLGDVPFKTVYLHGLIRDAEKKKMSKSTGNIIDPLDMISKYGTDALRFGLIFNTAPGTDIALAEDKIKGMKHFTNKVWNISRYILINLDSSKFTVPSSKNSELSTKNLSPITEADKTILTQLDQAIKEVTTHIDNFRLHAAAQALYQFVWYELADIYVEASKTQLADESLKENTQKILLHSLTTILKLLHPFMPFVTEELWDKLGNDKLLMITDWPK